MLTIRAPAKINLTLEVIGRRPDGYHDIVSVIQAIDLADVLTLEPAPSIAFTCDRVELAGADNLVMKAADLMRKQFKVQMGARLHLKKRIPVAAGLGGGSSDAAAAILGLAQLWDLRPARQEMLELAERLGSDVPFFLLGGTALAEGRGDRLTQLPPFPESWAVIVRPPGEIEGKTGKMYASLTPGDFTPGQAGTRLVQCLRQGLPPEPSLFHNCFDNPALRLFPQMESFRARFLEAGAPWARLAGSGPCLFTLLTQPDEAQVLWRRLLEEGTEAYLARTLARP